MNKKWELYDAKPEIIDKIAEENDIPEILATILANRSIVNSEEIKVFLNPTRNDFYDPYLMPDMQKAVERIIKAKEKQEKIMIYGDYDVDGITSITVLKKFLDSIGISARIYNT